MIKGGVFALALAVGLAAAASGCSHVFTRIPATSEQKGAGVHPEALGAYMDGIRAEKCGDWKEARERYARAHELEPGSLLVLVRLAVSTYESGRIEDAKPLMREAQQAAEKEPDVAIVLARFFARQGRVEEAARYYDIAARSDALKYSALYEEARLLEEAGEKGRAEQKYIALSEQVPRPISKVVLGEYYLRGGRYEAALKEFEAVAENEPFVYRYVAVCRAETGDLDGAIASLEKYKEKSCPAGPTVPQAELPGNVPIHEASEVVRVGSPWTPFLRVAEAAMAKGMPEKAVTVLKGALDCGGETSEILERLGDAYLAAGQKDKARESWTDALGLAQQDVDKNRLKGKLEGLDK